MLLRFRTCIYKKCCALSIFYSIKQGFIKCHNSYGKKQRGTNGGFVQLNVQRMVDTANKSKCGKNLFTMLPQTGAQIASFLLCIKEGSYIHSYTKSYPKKSVCQHFLFLTIGMIALFYFLWPENKNGISIDLKKYSDMCY